MYKFNRALGLSLVMYIATFVVAFICGAVLGDNKTSLNEMPEAYWYIGMVAAALLAFYFTKRYYKNPAVTPSPKSGLLFGLTVVVVALVLDVVFLSLGNSSPNPEAHMDLGKYFGDFRYWIIMILVLGASALAGHLEKPKTV